MTESLQPSAVSWQLKNPFEIRYSNVNKDVLDIFLIRRQARSGNFGDFWSDLGNTLTDGVAGLTQALGSALEAVVHTIGQIGETIALVVRACIGDVSWGDVLDSFGKVFQDIGTAMVFLDPTRQVYNWLSKAPLTGHAFHELDKFTGGMLTNVANVSDLPGRILRGDAISKLELIKDALFILQVVVVIITFPEGLALMVAMMVGRNVCSKQTQAREACMGAFVIAGAAVGDWAGEGNTFFDALEDAGLDFLKDTGVNIATRELIKLCQEDAWAGKHECQIMGTVLADYIKSDPDDMDDWAEFLGRELAKIGVSELILELYPPNSRERGAIERHIPPKPTKPLNVVNVPGASGSASSSTVMNPLTYLMLAAGAAAVLIGGS